MSHRVPAAPATGANANIAQHLSLMATSRPTAAAVKIPRGRTAAGDIDYLVLSFAELDVEVATWCDHLSRRGVQRGERTLVMVRQGLPLIASVFALFRLGAVPVVIDPGMGLKSFLTCVRRSQPRALVGIPMARFVSRVFPRAFASVRHRVPAATSLTARLSRPGGATASRRDIPVAVSAADELAAILFTSGSTGAPKGVCYEHGMFAAQIDAIRDTYAIAPGEIDLPLLPIFALFNPALGMTTIVPEIDPRRPAAFNPAHIVQAIRQEQVTNSFGSPTLWGKIAAHCAAEGIALPTLRRVLCAGAPVPAALWQQSRTLLPGGRLHSPYGATEALPIASIASDEVPAQSVAGACVGRPVRSARVKIIAVDDGPIAQLEAARELPPGEIGEIIVAGPMVTRTYDALPDATAAAKIVGRAANMSDVARDARGSAKAEVWHRMGDCGYFDADGRLWFCGRKVERVVTAEHTFYPEPCEQVFRQHPRAGRCALVGVDVRGDRRPALVVETRVTSGADASALAAELHALGRQCAHTAAIHRFYFRPNFPVDVRHNAKIHRLTLARWAASAEAVVVPVVAESPRG